MSRTVSRLHRRRYLQATGSLLLAPWLLKSLPARAMGVTAIRFTTVRDCTRITFESDAPLKFNYFLMQNPDRLVIDLDNLDNASGLKDKVVGFETTDPYIAKIRIGQFSAATTRVVFELKQAIAPQALTVPALDGPGQSLVLDVYAAEVGDALAQLANRPDDARPVEARPRPVPKADAKADPNPDLKPEPKVDGKGGKKDFMRLITIALDPGHGGEDPGAIGAGGSQEKFIALSIAKRLKQKIDGIPGMRAMLTRDDDYFVPLNVRVQKARRVQADLFVSIHADAFVRPDVRGSSVFALSEKGASSSAAKWLADKENAVDLLGGVDLKNRDRQLANVLLDLSTTAQINDSLKLGQAVLNEIGGINNLHKGEVEQAGFAVLKAPDIPSILVETAFISNPDEERRLNDHAYQDQMAAAIVGGIQKYFRKNPPAVRSRLSGMPVTDAAG